MLSQQLEQAPIEVVVSLTRFEATVGDMLAWKVGRVLACNIEDQLQAHAEGIPLFECSYGTLKGQHAIRIQKFLTHPERSLGAN